MAFPFREYRGPARALILKPDEPSESRGEKTGRDSHTTRSARSPNLRHFTEPFQPVLRRIPIFLTEKSCTEWTSLHANCANSQRRPKIAAVTGEPRDFRRRLLAWYGRSRRDLPWRVQKSPTTGGVTRLPDPYHVLLSETMLQQTQVATVVPYFQRFIGRFPTIGDLAAAGEQEVLRCWQGLGYYSRARNLHRCAREIVCTHGGEVPRDFATLLGLPGIGRYTAGAIASLAYDVPAPILDGNVTRVLCRLDAVTEDPRERSVVARLWARAAEILPKSRAGDFNSALMELGATVCTPRGPGCLICPVRAHCEAFARGIQDQVPAP